MKDDASWNPLFRGGKDKGEAGRKAEKNTAKRLGAKQRPGSGALDGAKGDLVHFDFLIENKSSQSLSMVLKMEWLLKIYNEALAEGKAPALGIQFILPSGKSERKTRWICIPEDVFEDLTQREE